MFDTHKNCVESKKVENYAKKSSIARNEDIYSLKIFSHFSRNTKNDF